jgi:hypothetical protein
MPDGDAVTYQFVAALSCEPNPLNGFKGVSSLLLNSYLYTYSLIGFGPLRADCWWQAITLYHSRYEAIPDLGCPGLIPRTLPHLNDGV